MKTKIKKQFLVMIGDEVVGQHARRKMAEAAAAYVGGYVVETWKEWQE